MKKLALLLLLAPALAVQSWSAVVQTPSPAPGSLESSKIRLDSQDAAGALKDAEIALAKGGGADAYAARADAKRALGRPVDEAIADYGEAAKLDPRYIEKWQGLIAQKASEIKPERDGGGKGLGGVPIAGIAVAGIAGLLLLLSAVKLLGNREPHSLAPDDEEPESGAPPAPKAA